jgi:prophage tail gpP-like protein
MREIYAHNNVETLVHCANLNGLVMTEEFKTNLKVFKEMNGGAASYHTINQNLGKYSQQIEAIFKNVDQLIINEQNKDQQVAKTTGNPNAITPFNTANQAEINQMTRNYPILDPNFNFF